MSATYAALQQQLSELHLAAAELGSSARLSEAQQQLAHMQATLAEADAEHEARVSSILSKLQVSVDGKGANKKSSQAGWGTAEVSLQQDQAACSCSGCAQTLRGLQGLLCAVCCPPACTLRGCV